MQLLTELNRDQGTTIVIVTHSERDAGNAQRIISLFDGQVALAYPHGTLINQKGYWVKWNYSKIAYSDNLSRLYFGYSNKFLCICSDKYIQSKMEALFKKHRIFISQTDTEIVRDISRVCLII